MLGEGRCVAMIAGAIARWRSTGRDVSPSAHARDAPSAEEGWIMHVATKTKVWTLEEVHSLPDDGNKYELVRGELFVTPPPGGSTRRFSRACRESWNRTCKASGLASSFTLGP